MITNVELNTQLNPIVDSQFKSEAVSPDFRELLAARSAANYDKLTEWAKGIWTKTVVHEIDASEIKGLYRKDFPQALLFNNDITLEELNKNSPAYPEPKSDFDPRAFSAGRAACRQNGVAILVSPGAIEKMNSDDEFYNNIMKQLEEMLYPSIQEYMKGLPRVTTKGDFIYTSTDCSIILEIDDNGYVDGKIISCGECRRVSDDEEQKHSDEIEYISTKSLDEDEGNFLLNRQSSEDEPLSAAQPEVDYLYNFLGSFNLAASENMSEHRKRK